jgi:uridine kinase
MLEIVIRGSHDTGKTTVANLIKMMLEESGYKSVQVADTPPLPDAKKPPFQERLNRNRQRPIKIRVELVK